MKHNRRLLSLVLAICLIVGLVPVMASAANTSYGPAVVMGSAIEDLQYVNFAGREWIVLDADATNTGNADGMLLLSKELAEASIAYNSNGKSSAWSGSDAQAWCATYLGGLSDAEQALLLPATKSAAGTAHFGVNWTGDALDAQTVFFLSAEEVETYFGENALVGTEFVTDTGWWLRSVNADRDIMAGVVSDAGFVGAPHVATNYGARPAINLRNAIAMVTAAEKPASLTEVAQLSTEPVWNLTFLDPSMNAVSVAEADAPNTITVMTAHKPWTITVSAAAGDKVSAVISDQMGDVLYYGPVAEIASDASTAAVTLPEDLVGKYTLQVFTEKTVDGIDYAGEPTEYTLFANDGMGCVDSWGLTLNDNIHAKFVMEIPNGTADVVVEVNGYTHTYEDVADGEVVTVNLAAAQMTDVISIKVDNGGGNESVVYEYSIRKYADIILSGDYSDETKALVKAMLNYGGKAQVYFNNYNSEAFADEGISVEEVAVPNENRAATVTGTASGITFSGTSLVHETRTAVRFYFTITDGQQHSFTNADGSVTYTAVPGSNMHYVEVDGISPADLDMTCSVIVDGTMTVEYGPMDYIIRMYNRESTSASLKAMLSAMYTYWDAAETYLASMQDAQ